MTGRTAPVPLYQVIDVNGALRSAHAIGAPVTMAGAVAIAAGRMPYPETWRPYCAIVARPIGGGPDVELRRGGVPMPE